MTLPVLFRITPMNYDIPIDVEQEISDLIATGRFQSASEVLREAMGALRKHDARLAELQASFDELEAGGGISLEELDQRMKQKHNFLTGTAE